MPFISNHLRIQTYVWKAWLRICFPLNALLRSLHLFITIFFLRGYMWTFTVIAHSWQYLSTHNETQLKRLWSIQWPQTEIFWMSFWGFYYSPVVLCWKKEKSYSNSSTIAWKSEGVWLSLIAKKRQAVFYTVIIMLSVVSSVTHSK